MIEVVTLEDSEPVIRHNGKLLASARDPRSEARAWVSRRLCFLKKARGVFVLGAGSGYHLEALRAQTEASILVIEQSLEITAAARGLQNLNLEDVRIETIGDSLDLRGNAVVQAMVRSSYVVLVHPASRAQNPNFYDACAKQLIGREWSALAWAWKLKGLPLLERTPRVFATAAEPLTIHDLAHTALINESSLRERMLVKALRELVK